MPFPIPDFDNRFLFVLYGYEWIGSDAAETMFGPPNTNIILRGRGGHDVLHGGTGIDRLWADRSIRGAGRSIHRAARLACGSRGTWTRASPARPGR